MITEEIKPDSVEKNTSKTSTTSKRKKRKQKRKRLAGIRPFPSNSLEDSLKIPNIIKEKNGGNPWSPPEVASALGIGIKGNNFYYLSASSRDYGLTIGTSRAKEIDLATIGKQIVYAKSKSEEIDGYKKSFFNVPLFKTVYEYYNGGSLPEIQYLKNTLIDKFKVQEKYHDDFYQLFQINLSFLKKTAGSFAKVEEGKASADKEHSIIIGEPGDKTSPTAFVIMPFVEKTKLFTNGFFDEVLKHLITPAAVKAGFKVITAKKEGSDVIQSTIVNDLMNASLVIADLTEHNPNVLFELGLRIAFEKPVALIRAEGTSAIFDVDHMLRVYDYSPNLWPTTIEKDIPKLCEHVKATWLNKEKDKSYLKILKSQ